MSTPSNTNGMTPNAANRVFAVAELLEMILLHIPATIKEVPSCVFPPTRTWTMKTAANSIIAVKRVSRTFNDTINDSPKLQRRINELSPLIYIRRLETKHLPASVLICEHDADVQQACYRATHFLTDETIGQSWRSIVALGELDFKMDFEFFIDAEAKIQLEVESGETFDQMAKRYRLTLESQGMAPTETPEMFYERMARKARWRVWR